MSQFLVDGLITFLKYRVHSNFVFVLFCFKIKDEIIISFLGTGKTDLEM